MVRTDHGLRSTHLVHSGEAPPTGSLVVCWQKRNGAPKGLAMIEVTGKTTALHEPDAAEARRRLVEPLPVTERQISIAGVETALLEGGEGPPSFSSTVRGSRRCGGCASSPIW